MSEDGESRYKFKILPAPAALPTKCIACGCSTKPVVDFACDIDWYGAVYFCEDCIVEAARMFGMVSTEQYNKVFDEAQRLNSNMKDATNTIEDAVREINERVHLLSADIGTVLAVPWQRGTDSSTEGTEEQPAVSKSSIDATRKNSRTASSKGSVGVPDDTVNEPELSFGFN
jgi:transcription elongation factor Elf1